MCGMNCKVFVHKREKETEIVYPIVIKSTNAF